MARRKTRVAQRQQRKKLQAVVIVVALVGLIVGGGAWFLVEKGKLQSVDAHLCPPAPTEFTAVIVDVTDPLTVAQRQDLRNRLGGLRESIGLNGQIAFFTVDESADGLLRPLIKRCNPGTASDFSEFDRDLKQVQKTYDEEFVGPLVDSYEKIFEASGSERSPILQSIQSVNLTELQAPAAKGKPKRIVLISDLLQHTEQLSFYGARPSAEAVMANPDFEAARTNLRGVGVELWMLQRPDHQQTQPRDLAELWNVLLQEQGAARVDIKRISG